MCYRLIDERGFPNDDALIAAIAIYVSCGRGAPAIGRTASWSIFRILMASTSVVRGCLCRIFKVIGSDPDSFHRGIVLDLLTKRPPNGPELVQVTLIIEELARAFYQLPRELTVHTNLEPRADAAMLNQAVQGLRLLARSAIEGVELFSGPDSALRPFAELCLKDGEQQAKLIESLGDIYSRLFVGEQSVQALYRTALCVELILGRPSDQWLDEAFDQLSAN